MPEVLCPHYPPAVINNSQYFCRGCGSLVADRTNASVQQSGLPQNSVFLARPEVRNAARKAERRG